MGILSARNKIFIIPIFKKLVYTTLLNFYSTCYTSLLNACVLIILQCKILSIIPVVNIFLLNFFWHSVL